MIIVVTGPTASGKTKLSEVLAKKYNGIIFTNTVVKNVEKADDYYQVYANENIIKYLIQI